jgi:hypothetical protein
MGAIERGKTKNERDRGEELRVVSIWHVTLPPSRAAEERQCRALDPIYSPNFFRRGPSIEDVVAQTCYLRNFF